MLRRLIYISQSMIGADPEGLEAIVSSSVRWNAGVQVTGMLWADGARFAQVIEGDPDAVQLTMDRIRTDHRHSCIDVLLDRTVLSRQFGSWSMRHAGNDDSSARGTTFMIGFAMTNRTASGRQLYEIVMDSQAGTIAEL